MYRKLLITVIAVALITAVPVMGQDDGDGNSTFRGWGPRVGLTIDPDQIHFGAHVDLGYIAERVRFQPDVELGLGDDFTILEIGGDFHYRFRADWNVWTPYLGGGPAILFIDFDNNGLGDGSDTEFGLNAVFGIEKGISGGDRFFIEAQAGLVDAPDWKFTVGWTFF